MSSRHAPATFAVIALLLLAGCSQPEETIDPLAAPGQDLGGDGATVSGTVVDSEQNPVGDAQVVLDGLAQTNTTASGAFIFRNVPTGTHRLLVQALGYQGIGRQVTVAPGETLELFVSLDALRIDEPYSQIIPIEGHICFQMNFGHATPTILNGGNLACGGSGSIFLNFEVEKGLVTLVAEMTWEQTSTLTAPELNLRLWQGGARSGAFSCDYCYGSAVGTSPVYLRLDDGQGQGSSDTPWTGVNCADCPEVSTLTDTIYVPPDSSTAHGVNIVFDQRISVFNALFYGARAPQGFSSLPDS